MGEKRGGKTDFCIFCVGNTAAAETLATADTGGTLPDRQVEKLRIYNSHDSSGLPTIYTASRI